jgi:uncharacterized membrane protein
MNGEVITIHEPNEGALHTSLMIAGCSTALLSLIPIALYQLDALPSLPDPPLNIFDSERIVQSKTAHPFGFPDAVLGLGSFGITLALILLGRRAPVIRRALAAKLALDVGVAAFNATRQIVSFRKLCSWCCLTVAAAWFTAYSGRKVMEQTVLEIESIAKKEICCG